MRKFKIIFGIFKPGSVFDLIPDKDKDKLNKIKQGTSTGAADTGKIMKLLDFTVRFE